MPRRTIHLPDHIEKTLDVKEGIDSVSGRVADIIDRYGEIIRDEIPKIEKIFTKQELYFVIGNAILGTIWQPASHIAWGIRANIEDMEPFYFKETGIKREDLLKKIDSLSVAQKIAVVERIRRYLKTGGEIPEE